jgi:phospholipase/lecithinase/hemolysin
MVDTPKKPDYKGADDITFAFGQSAVDGQVGALIGGAAGAAAGAMMHKKLDVAAMAEAKDVLRNSEKFGEMMKAGWKVLNRGGKALAMGLVGAALIGQITQLTGAFRGVGKAKEARNQFEEITGENTTLRTQLEAAQEKISLAEERAATAEKNLESTKSFVSVLQSERAQPKGKDGPSPA